MARTKDTIGVKGSFRIKIVNDQGDGTGPVVGDSGWQKNQVVNLGFLDYLAKTVLGSAGSKQITHIALGEGTAPGAAATSLESEIDHGVNRLAITAGTSSDSKKARVTGTFASSASYISTTATLQNIGLFNTSTSTTGTLLCGNTYATSTCASNQAVNVTYDLDFS